MNAIIMAAGTSSRFVPLSYEKPKGLLKVRGEVLIERQICQLIEAGITDITIVVGYKAELFRYLAGKYGVHIVVNEDYMRYNNTSSLIRVVDRLEDTYICSSDNYFTKNVFLEKVENSYYSALYSSTDTDEYCMVLDGDEIQEVHIGGRESWYMIGHAYFNKQFSQAFKTILQEEYDKEETKLGYWEDVYINHIHQLPKMCIRRYQPLDLVEFDSLEELRLFDDTYINNTGCAIFHNICSILKCQEKDIVNIKPLKKGMTNSSFVFTCELDKRQYVYRHPGDGTEQFINRDSEYFSMKVASQLGLDCTFVYMHPKDGWKLSYYIPDAHPLDYFNDKELEQALTLLRELHQANVQSKYAYRLWEQAEDFLAKIKKEGRDEAVDFYSLYGMLKQLHQYTLEDGWGECLNHCDALADNFLIDSEGKMTLIDWEYSGQGDTAQDIGSFIACSDMDYDRAVVAIQRYLKRIPNNEELSHYLAYVAIASYTWYLWAIYQSYHGVDTLEYMKQWHKYAYLYGEKALKLYNKN